MSQNIPTPTGEPRSDQDALIREMHEKLLALDGQVNELAEDRDALEAQNNELEQTVTVLKKKISRLESKNQTLEDRTETLEERVSTMATRVERASLRADELEAAIDQAQQDLTDQAFHSQEKLAELAQRVTGIEHELELEDWESLASLSANACALERFSAMPVDRRKAELSAPVTRATLVWEHFDAWSSPTRNGRVLRSSELRRLIEAKTNTDLAWTQVYRLMEEFDANTTAQYEYIGTDKTADHEEKALVRNRNIGNNP